MDGAAGDFGAPPRANGRSPLAGSAALELRLGAGVRSNQHSVSLLCGVSLLACVGCRLERLQIPQDLVDVRHPVSAV